MWNIWAIQMALGRMTELFLFVENAYIDMKLKKKNLKLMIIIIVFTIVFIVSDVQYMLIAKDS